MADAMIEAGHVTTTSSMQVVLASPRMHIALAAWSEASGSIGAL
jgi:hypothetical protein